MKIAPDLTEKGLRFLQSGQLFVVLAKALDQYEKNEGETMETIRKHIDEQNKKIAVQIPINTFEKIEEILENYALVQLMKKNEGKKALSINEAKAYYDKLEKAQ